ncbi:adhesion G-protein coupled receptor G4 [Genypterus blacodes]|uniref:adhesion G-protein coupled receptor G4 n=1 Tax=Genypterus blacodes TaxID=154954 RepID=UPI003F75C7F4
MNIPHRLLSVFVSVSLLVGSACTVARVRPQLSLWGKVADFPSCSHWRLKPHVSIPSLQEFTVCLQLLQVQTSSWVAFMYRHPELQCAELGLGGESGHLVVWLFGMKWITSLSRLPLGRWNSVCLTWSHPDSRPALYVNGAVVDITPAHEDEDRSPLTSQSCCTMAANGTLSLGAAHRLVNGRMEILSGSRMSGRLSLFRLWGRRRSEEEVTSLYCTEGDLVKWERDNWDTQTCAPLPDHSLECGWSVYEVTLMFAIVRSDGNNTEVYTARDVAHLWLREVLPPNMYLHRVSVFEVTRYQDGPDKASHPEKLVRWTPPNIDRFECLVHVNVIPKLDVAAVQRELYKDLKTPYNDPNGLLLLLADIENIHTTPVGRKHLESCVFQVKVLASPSDTPETETRLQHLLEAPYNNGSISVATEDVQINRILIFECSAHVQHTRKGLFQWPATDGGRNATQPCPKNPLHHASRHCKLCLSTKWMDPDLDHCPPMVETIPDLDHVEVTADNAPDVVQMIKSLLSNLSKLNYDDLDTILNKLKDIINISVVTPDLGQCLINIISNILESDSDLVPFTNTILNITEAVGDRLVGFEGSTTLVAPAIAVSIFINRQPFNGTVAFISLPSVLQHSFPQYGLNHSQPRVQFQFYGIPLLFRSSKKGQILNTFVVSASVTNASSPIKDLDEHVQVTLAHLTHNTDVECVYWNFNKNNGHGGWDGYGCRKHNSSSNYTTCLCDHLTHFGVLLDVSRTQVDPANEQILTIITYAGCGVSSLFLGITVLTYTAFEKLRRDYPSQILINLSLALMGLNLVFLVNSWLSSWGINGLCVAVASLLHYFLLASFTWMGLEAVNMYFALVKVFNVYVPSYILKFCTLGWGIPLVICVLVLIINREAYGSNLYTDAQTSLQRLEDSESFCWLQDDVTFYVSVVAYAGLILLFNTGVFVVVLIQIRHMRVNRPAGIRSGLMHDLKGVASLTLLLGLTWTVGFFTWGPARVFMLYLFSGLNTLQGLFIFFFHCLMKENVRKQWRIHLCFGRFRLEEHSV